MIYISTLTGFLNLPDGLHFEKCRPEDVDAILFVFTINVATHLVIRNY